MSNPFATQDSDADARMPQGTSSGQQPGIPSLAFDGMDAATHYSANPSSNYSWPPASATNRIGDESFFSNAGYYMDAPMADASSQYQAAPPESFNPEFLAGLPRPTGFMTLQNQVLSPHTPTPPDTDSDHPRIPLLPPVGAQSAERRRQQNRSAQRAFRERKESYTIQLENEVATLRARYEALVNALSSFRDAFVEIDHIIQGHRKADAETSPARRIVAAATQRERQSLTPGSGSAETDASAVARGREPASTKGNGKGRGKGKGQDRESK